MKRETLAVKYSPARVAFLIKNRAYEDLPALAIGAGIAAGLNLISIVLGGRAFMNESGGQAWTFAISIAGFLLAGAAFKGMHDGRSGTDWLLLPASGLEKYSSALIAYLVVYPIAASVAATALSALLSLAELIAGGPGGNIWNPIEAIGVESAANYAITALVLAVGSAAFRKRALIKTIGVGVAYALAAGGLVFLLILLVRNLRGLPMPEISAIGDTISIEGDFKFQAPKAVDYILNAAYYALLPLSALAYGYFRVAEKEARDEVQ